MAAARGVFGVRGLRTAGDFIHLANAAVERSAALVSSVAQTSKLDRQLLSQLDQISNAICLVADAANVCISVHSDEHFKNCARNAYQTLGGFLSELNMHRPLYDVVRRAQEDPQLRATLDEEDTRMLNSIAYEFVVNGVHLEGEERNQVLALRQRILELEADFSGRVHADNAANTVELKEQHLSGLPRDILNTLPRGSSPGTVQLRTTPGMVNTVLRWCADEGVRRDVYLSGCTDAAANLPVLEELAATRHQLAVGLGFDSYAAFVTSDKMVKNPQRVHELVTTVGERLRPHAERELALLRDAKTRLTGTPSQVEPWDVSYLIGALKAELCGISAGTLDQYLTLDNVLAGLSLVCNRVFGVTLEREDPSRDELWCNPRDVLKLIAHHPTEGRLGCVYMDLYARPHKFHNAAHYAIQCGCELPGEEGGGYQLPTVMLACSVVRPQRGGSPPSLSVSAAETVFHEFGHALHSLLSRTRYQHLSGTRCPTDFVEVPSHLFENFLFDSRVLPLFAIDSRRRPISGVLAHRLHMSSRLFGALNYQQQAVLTLFDQRCFGRRHPGQSLQELYHEVSEAHSLVPAAPGTHWFTRFSHLVNYGGLYYSYLVAGVYAGAIWKQCFADEPLSPEAGARYWQEVLRHGGARDPHDMLAGLLGTQNEEELVDAYVASIAEADATMVASM